VTNEEFEHIIYYPVFNKKSQVKAILEVSFHRKQNLPTTLVPEKTGLVLGQIETQLDFF
jgi:hypothetical protein